MTTASADEAKSNLPSDVSADVARVIDTFADTISDILYVLDADRRIVWCNRYVERVTGVPRDRLVSKPKLDLIVKEDRHLVQATYAGDLRDDVEFEARVATANGPVNYHFKCVALKDSDGRAIGRVGVGRDISEHKRAEEAVRRENAFVRLLQSIATVANGAETVNEALQFAVDRICAHTGWPVGHVYKREDGGEFVSAGIWSAETSALFQDFREVSEAAPLGPGTGIAGWVAATGKAAWITDVTRQPRFVRAKLAKQTGLKAGFAFPVVVGEEIVAVLEFFSTEFEEPNDRLLDVMVHVGTQLGRVIERQRAQEQLQRSEDRFRTLVESSPDALVVYTGNGVISLANESAAHLVGAKSPDDLAGMTVWDFVHPDDVELIKERGRRLADGEGLLTPTELRFVRLDGKPVDVESVARPIVYEGRPAVQVSARDITARRRIETELREREKQLSQAQSLAHLGYWHWDILLDRITFSQELGEIFGLKSGELAGPMERYLERAHSDDREFIRAIIEAAKADLKPFTFEQRIVHPDGAVRFLSCHGEVSADSDGNPSSMIGVCQDITDRRRVEDAVSQQLRDLERTRQDLEQFAYVASHDLQEPLRMVSSYVQLLERRYKGRLDEDANDFIQFAVDGARRMQELINGLLAYSRIGTRGRPFQPTDFGAVVDSTLAALKKTLDDAHAIVIRDSLPVVAADASQVELLYSNLIGNSLKFVNGRRPRIHIGVQDRDGELVFFVRDNGIGIDPQYAERVFTIFQRLHGRDQYPGAGMGLAICKRIVERRGGRIWVESNPGSGATFYFTMPQRGSGSDDVGQ